MQQSSVCAVASVPPRHGAARAGCPKPCSQGQDAGGGHDVEGGPGGYATTPAMILRRSAKCNTRRRACMVGRVQRRALCTQLHVDVSTVAK